MIKVKVFDDYGVETDVERFINEHGITRQQIISINLAIDSEAHHRMRSRNSKQIMLVWEE